MGTATGELRGSGVLAQPPSEGAHRTRLPMILAFAAGTLLSLAWSWHPSLWSDEAATISASSRSWTELVAMAGHVDAVHATYYGLMHLWLEVVPTTAFTLRLPSAVIVGLTAVGVLLLGSRLGGARTGALATVAFVLLPRTTWAGVEARPFALSGLVATAATLVLQLAVEEGPQVVRRSRRTALLAGYAALAGLGIAVNVYLGLLLVAHGLTLLLSPRVGWPLRLRWLVAGLVGVGLSSPVVWPAVHQSGQLGGNAFGWFTWARNVFVNQWFLGETPTLTTGGAELLGGAGISWKLASIALAALCWAVVVLGLLRNPLGPVVRWAGPWVAVPTLVIGVYSVTVHDMYSSRYFTFATAGTALLIGHGLAGLASRRTTAVLVAAMVVLAAPVYVSQRGLHAKSSADWSEVAGFVAAHSEPGEGVYFSPRYPIDGPVVLQTARGVATAYPAAFSSLVDVTLVSAAVEDENLTGRSALLESSGDRWNRLDAVWVIRRHDYAYSARDERTLAAAGFVPTLRWSGPLDEVVEYRSRP